MKIKIFLTVVAFVFAVAGGSLYAIAAGNVDGWLWGGSDDGGVSAIGTAMGWIDMGEDSANVTVSIPGVNGPVIGYAWSEHYGWIDFEPQNNCGIAYGAASCTAPAGGTAGVQRLNNALINYARVVSIAEASVSGNNGGWDGWIQMDPAFGGVTIDPGTGALSGFAWSGESAPLEGIGWIDFGLASIPVGLNLLICEDNCNNVASPTPLSGTVDMTEGDTKNVRACYTPAVTCTDPIATDVTYDPSVLVEVAGGAVTISGSAPAAKIITADTAGLETISSSYLGKTADFDVNVTALPGVPPTVNLSGTQILLGPGESLPQDTRLTWSLAGDTTLYTCIASGGNWSGNIDVLGDYEDVQQDNPVVTYTLTCNGPNGPASANETVRSYCTTSECADSTTCITGVHITDNGDDQLCVRECPGGAIECANPDKKWREVSP